ncbi:MAG TPA: DUF3488 and transglutaminase-like domain-containing protein, partial [Candidatus Angelobacter sp.]|nr:DUF3488 and transglutaminase-like domain-containing protein [Candidatus Angelobacter sp.]
QDVKFHGSLAVISTILGLLTLLGAALIFFILPRINSSGYLRNLGVQGSISTGFNQEVNLGGIGEIQQSDNVVMHVQVLSGRLPEDVKWRGISLANFDGHHWWNSPEVPSFRGLNNSPLDLTHLNNQSLYIDAWAAPHVPTLTYRVIMEPVGLNLFFLAPVPLKINGNYHVVEIKPDGSVFNTHPAEGSMGANDAETPQIIGTYYAEADTRNPERLVRDSNSRSYPSHIATLYLQKPRLDPRIADLARQITATSTSNYARAKAIEHYLQNNFGYTLQLPGLREPDPLAHFLFERKKGHCEYFASSMTMMLRTLGIPARIVNGFRGGEYNDLTGSYIVREKNAHSWVEVYFPEYGWVTFDPTPGGSTVDSTTRWSRFSLYMDAARELWRDWIVNYDFSHQMTLRREITNQTINAQSSFKSWLWHKYNRLVRTMGNFQRRLERLSPSEMTLCCVLLALLLVMPFTPKLWRSFQRTRALRNPHRAPRTSASFWYERMLKMVARRGWRKHPSQTPEEFISTIEDPLTRQDVELFTECYERARFAESIPDAERLPELYEEMAGRR